MHKSPLAESAAVILGAHRWSRYPAFKGHKGFRHSAEDLRDYLLRNGLPGDNLLWLFHDVGQPATLIRRIIDFLRRPRPPGATAVRNVITYYVGHGTYLDGAYVVAPRCTDGVTLVTTTLSVREIARVLAENAPDKRHVVIIDACYAAGAIPAFLGQDAEQPAQSMAEQMREHLDSVDINRGTTLFCAAGARVKAKLPLNGRHTMFSGALLRSLEKGLQTAGPFLPLDTVAFLVENEIRETYGIEAVRPELHTPRQEKGDIRTLPLFPNPAHAQRDVDGAAANETIQAPDPPPTGLAHESAWLKESARLGWYELLEVRKEIDRSGDVVQTHLLTGIHGPKEGEISAIPYEFRAEPQFGTCALAQVTDIQRGWSMQEEELPKPSMRLVGKWPLSPPARRDTVHRGLSATSRVFNSFAITSVDARLRGHPPVEHTSVSGSFPVRNLRLVALFPPGYEPKEIVVTALHVDGDDKSGRQWREAPEETARVAPTFFFERERGVAILSIERALPEFHYRLNWRLPEAPTPPVRALEQAGRQVRGLFGLDPAKRASLRAGLSTVRDGLARRHLLWDGRRGPATELTLFAYDETTKLVRVVSTTLDGPAAEVAFPWGTGVVGWVMRRRRPAFVDTRDRHTAGIYRVIDGTPLDRHLLSVPLPLPIDSEQPAVVLADPAMPCLVVTLSSVEERANLGLLIDEAELLGKVSSDLAVHVLDLLTGASLY